MTNQQYQDKVISDFREKFSVMDTIFKDYAVHKRDMLRDEHIQSFILDSLNNYKKLIREEIEGNKIKPGHCISNRPFANDFYNDALTDILNSNLLK